MLDRKNRIVFCFFILSFIFFKGLSCKSAPKDVHIIELVKAGNTDELRVKFDKHSVNEKDENGYTLLHIAAKQNSAPVTDFLCSMGADTEAKDSTGKTPLLYALEQNSFDAAKALISNNAGIFTADNEGMTPFLFADKNSLHEYVLNEKTVKQKDDDGRTALHYAVMNFNRPLVKHILSFGKPHAGKDKEGETILDYVYKNPHNPESAAIACELLTGGAEPVQKDFSEFETSVLKRNYAMRFTGGKTALHIAAGKGLPVFVKFLLSKGAPVNAKDESNSAPLHEAVRNGHLSCVKFLFESGADANAVDISGNSALHLIIPEASREALFAELLKTGTSPSIKDDYGETPLHIVSRVGMNKNIVTMLVKAGADINERNRKGQTPLFFSVMRNDTEQSHMLVSLGADIHAADIHGNTSFTKALELGLPMVQSLVDEKNIMSKDSNGKTPVHIATERNVSADILYYFIEKKADVNTRDMAGGTPLHIAAEMNNKELGSILINNNADIFYANDKGDSPLKIALTKRNGREEWMLTSKTLEAKDGRGNTPLHLAAEWGLTYVTDYIIDRGGDVNALNANNETPIFSAVKANSPAVLQILLTKNGGAGKNSVKLRDFLGNSVLHAAVRWSSYEAAQVFLNSEKTYGYKITDAKNLAGKTPLHAAAGSGDLSFIKMFLFYNGDINAADEMGKTPLSEAILAGGNETVSFLLKNHASPVVQDMYGQTPLHEAVIMGNIACINMIRTAGGNPMSRDFYGQTPFTLSLYKGEDIMNAVLGKDKFLADSDGKTPIHSAVIEAVTPAIMKFILAKGYPVDKRDRNGETALFCAVSRGENENSRLIFSSGADPFIANNSGENVVSEILKNKKDFLEMLVEFSDGRTDSLGDSILHYAARFADTQTIEKLLVLTRPDLSAKNSSGETPYQVALSWSRNEAAALLNPNPIQAESIDNVQNEAENKDLSNENGTDETEVNNENTENIEKEKNETGNIQADTETTQPEDSAGGI